MSMLVRTVLVVFAVGGAWSADAKESPKESPRAILDRVLEHDFWGLSGAKIKATAVLKDKAGKSRTLTLEGQSRKYRGYLTKSLVRFLRPPDLAGAAFLQIQNDTRDDDRFLYLPELRRTRRVAGGQRSAAFVGTDFSFADMDRRDLREAAVSSAPDEKVKGFDCHHVVVVPRRPDSPYGRIDLYARKNDFVPLRMEMYERSKRHLKTLKVLQIKRISGRWFITKSQMLNHRDNHSTLLLLTEVKPTDAIPDDQFTQDRLTR